MRYKGRKKSGNSLLLVLAIAFICTMVGGVTVTSIMSTSRLNQNSKIEDDLIYAAESGLETALGKLEGRQYKSIRGAEKYTVSIDLTNTIDRVEVSMKPNSTISGENIINVESTAFAKIGSQKKTVECNIKDNSSKVVNNGRNIFEYSLVAAAPGGKITTTDNASMNMQTAVVNANGGLDMSGKGSTVMPSNGNIDKNSYPSLKLIPGVKKAGKLQVVSSGGKIINNLSEGDKEIKVINIDQFVNDISGVISIPNNEGVVSFNFTTKGNQVYTVGIINSDEVLVDNNIVLNNDFDVLIITGNLKMKGTSAMTMSYSTLYSSSIELNGNASIHITYASGDPLYGRILADDIKVLNEKISKVIPNWNSVCGGNGGSSEGSSNPDYDFVDDSFIYD